MELFEYTPEKIQDLKVDCIINSFNPMEPASRQGAICRKLFEVGGKTFADNVMKAGTGLDYTDVFVTKSKGSIKAKYVINMCTPFREQDPTLKYMYRTFVKVFEEAIKLKCKSIAIPYVGTGANKYLAKDITLAVRTYLEKNPTTIKVYLCSKNYKHELCDEFDIILSKSSCKYVRKRENMNYRFVGPRNREYIPILSEDVDDGHKYIKKYIEKIGGDFEEYKKDIRVFFADSASVTNTSLMSKIINGQKPYPVFACLSCACVLDMNKNNFIELCKMFGHPMMGYKALEAFSLRMYEYDLVHNTIEVSDLMEDLLNSDKI